MVEHSAGNDGSEMRHGDCVCFSFVNGDSGEDDIIGYNSDTEVISVLGKACNSYIDCEAIECIEVYK